MFLRILPEVSDPRRCTKGSRPLGTRLRALGNPGARFVSDWFQQKTIKVFLIGLFKFARERLNVRRVWRVSGFFP